MRKNTALFLKELSFGEKKTLTVSFLEFTLKNYQFELETDPSGLTAEQMEPIFSDLRNQISKVGAMTDNTRNVKGLSDAIKDLLTILKRGQKEETCHRLNYCLKQTLPDALFAKLYGIVGVSLEDIDFNKELYPYPS